MTQEQLERLLKNYSNARKSWEGWCYLNNINRAKPNHKIRDYCDSNELLMHSRYLMCKDFHIELYKVLKDTKNTHDNIFGFLRNQNDNASNKQLLKLEEANDIIISIIKSRDKFYAHLDKDYEGFIGQFNLKDYLKVFTLIEDSIIVLGKKTDLLNYLKLIPSRDDFKIAID